LKLGESQLDSRQPTSRVARELILRGAKDLLANSGSELDRWLDEKGASPATRSIKEMRSIVAGLGVPDPDNPRRFPTRSPRCARKTIASGVLMTELIYLDASACVKLVLVEPESLAARQAGLDVHAPG